jgi:hypothetical protein
VRFGRSSDEQICKAVDVKSNSAHLYTEFQIKRRKQFKIVQVYSALRIVVLN